MTTPSNAQGNAGAVSSEAELLELLETLYNSRNPTRRWLHCTRRDWVIAKLRECARERPGRAIEVGFGAGVYLPALAESYREVVATDLDESHLAHAQPLLARYPNLRVTTDDITASRLPAGDFDLVLCSEVIEHIPDTRGVIAGLRRLLAPQGILILSTPQRYSLMELACRIAFLPGIIDLVRKIYGEAVFETGHINLMTARAVAAAIEGAGLEIRERFKSGLYIPVIAEFGGPPGLRLAEWLEKRLRAGPLSFALWTQYYVAQLSRPAARNEHIG
ncbi:MAG TPA: class I SAM-dependent methyltransferase [Candidatus Binataceae bacterium]|nr:class I SAM-dependent methyltransferase [Candidatus Binataceae bacterium]